MAQWDVKPARPVGRSLRLVTGLALLAEATRHFLGAAPSIVLASSGVALGELGFYVALHAVIGRAFAGLNSYLGAVVALAPVVAVFVLGGPPGRLGTLAFVGVSLVLAAIRADRGCEVMTLPALLFGRRTHLACLAFSPIDWLEEKRARKTTE